MAASKNRPNSNQSPKAGASGATSKSSKNREEILRLREEANARRQKEEAAAKRKRMLTQLGVIGGALLVVAAVVAFAIFAPMLFGKQYKPDAVNGNVEVTGADGAQVSMPITVENDAITVGKTDAPVTIDYYFDFSCPHCRDYHAALGPAYESVIADGSAKVRFHFIKFVDDFGIRAGSTVVSALEYQPELFFTLMDGYFAMDPQTLYTWDYNQFADSLAQFGVTNPQAIQDAREGKYAWWVSDRTKAARAAGVTGTPSVAINGQIQTDLPTDEVGLRALIAANGGPAAPEAPAATDATPAPTGQSTEQAPATSAPTNG